MRRRLRQPRAPRVLQARLVPRKWFRRPEHREPLVNPVHPEHLPPRIILRPVRPALLALLERQALLRLHRQHPDRLMPEHPGGVDPAGMLAY
jgi:hypothetical protein